MSQALALRPQQLPDLGPQRLSDGAFEVAVGILSATWPKEPLPPATLIVYRACLAHLDDDVIVMAALHCARTKTFMPKPAEVLEAAHDLLTERGDGPPFVDDAWHAVTTALGRWSPGIPCPAAEALHPLVRQALQRIGGLSTLANATHKEHTAHSQHFERVYSHFRQRHFLRLTGLAGIAALPDRSDPTPPPE